MRERAQASVEWIALLAAAIALAAGLLLGVTRIAPPLAAAIGEAVAGAFEAGTPTAPGLDAFGGILLTGATSPGPGGPTLLDLRRHLRSRLDRQAADAAFATSLRGLVARVLAAHAIEARASRIDIVERATEDAWLRHRFHPGRTDRIAGTVARIAGAPGSIVALAEDVGLEHEPDAIEPGYAAGDLVVHIGVGLRELVLRREPGSGLSVIADRAPIPARGGVR